MQFFRKNNGFRLLCLLMAFRVFNLTIEKTNFQSKDTFSLFTFFNQDAIVKMIFEECVVVYALVSELSTSIDFEGDTEITQEINEYSNVVQQINIYLPSLNIDNSFKYAHVYISQYVNEVSHPPPEA
jgi:hypothetical protein